MSDTAISRSLNIPPPAPPLPPGRLVQLHRFITPWGKNLGVKSHGNAVRDHDNDSLDRITDIHNYSSHAPETTTHRTGIPIAALDINQGKTHAILAGKEILKTARIEDGKVTEDFNLRASITSYSSTHASTHLETAEKRREYLPARDVRWSTKHYKNIVATAAANGRIALYDLNAPSARTEWAWLHEHTGQINKLQFDPHAGYLLLSASQDKSVKLWDMRVPKPERSMSKFEVRSAVRDVRWNPIGPFEFAICADGGVIQKWDTRVPTLLQLSINAHDKGCYAIDYHPDGRHIISGGFDKYVRVWDFETEKKRQKPVLQLKTPHAIRNIKWRPACTVDVSMDNTKVVQSTQVAVSYYHDDPRIHVWDLRRPLLPFRDLDRYNTPANDILWAAQDLLWTVGDDGIFTQWDLKHTAPFQSQLASCTAHISANGAQHTFAKSKTGRVVSSLQDPAVGFSRYSQDRLSGGDDAFASQSLTDDEDGFEATNETSSQHREIIHPSSRSNKSQANSPPSLDDKKKILPFDRAVLADADSFDDDQLGASGHVLGIAAESEAVSYLASHYALPATMEENRASPETILKRLESAFNDNADACDVVAMHRMAQTWRILSTVIVPELQDWANANRAQRWADAARRKKALEDVEKERRRSGLSPLAGLATRGGDSRYDSKSHKLMSSLFKSTTESGRLHSAFDIDSASNMTTPLAKPLPTSPLADDRRWHQMHIDDGLDSLPPLPPSMLNSHSTAAAAARALMTSPDRATRSDSSAPELRRTSGNNDKFSPTYESPISPSKGTKPRASVDQKQNAVQYKTQEDRRAALRDYRVQARPILSLGDPKHSGVSGQIHGSADSFPMFSVSTDSSQRVLSGGRSFDSPQPGARAAISRQVSDLSSDNDDEYGTSHAAHQAESLNAHQLAGTTSDPSQADVQVTDGTARYPHLEAGTNIQPASQDNTSWGIPQEHDSLLRAQMGTTVSTSPDIFHFEGGDSLNSMPKPRVHVSNPIRTGNNKSQNSESTYSAGRGSNDRLTLDELDCRTYLAQDFRPIDLSKYEPTQPFAWSALPLICQCIAFDMENGVGHGQFAAHLLTHVHQYFFHARFRGLQQQDDRIANSLADRLMTPQLGHRIIGSIFENHVAYLGQMRLHESAALMRKMCVEFEYLHIYRPTSETSQTGPSRTSRDLNLLSVTCATCQAPMATGKASCERCRRGRPACPICQSLAGGFETGLSAVSTHQSEFWGQNHSMWMACPACSHSGHVRCLMQWFCHPFSEGTCPTPGCGCDCGPGLTRERRVHQQIKREKEAKLIRTTSPGRSDSGSTKRDPLRASPSPAVDKTRVALRNSFAGERTTQSGGERGLPSRRSSGQGRIGRFSASRKSVRLITPGEEGEQSRSRS